MLFRSPATAKDAGIPASDQHLPITLVADGQLSRENLALAKKDRAWVEKVLSRQGAELKSTMLLTVDSADRILFIRKEDNA